MKNKMFFAYYQKRMFHRHNKNYIYKPTHFVELQKNTYIYSTYGALVNEKNKLYTFS